MIPPPRQRQRHIKLGGELACSSELKGHTGSRLAVGGSLAAGTAINARHVVSEVLDKERYPDPPGLGMGMRLTPLLVRTQPSQNPSNGRPWPKTG